MSLSIEKASLPLELFVLRVFLPTLLVQLVEEGEVNLVLAANETSVETLIAVVIGESESLLLLDFTGDWMGVDAGDEVTSDGDTVDVMASACNFIPCSLEEATVNRHMS